MPPPPKKKSDFQSLKVQIWPKTGLWIILGQIFAFLTHLIDAIGLLHCRSFFTSNFANYFSIQICLQITILHNYCCSCGQGGWNDQSGQRGQVSQGSACSICIQKKIWPSNHQVIETNRDVMPVTDTRIGIENKESFTKGLLCNIQGVF